MTSASFDYIRRIIPATETLFVTPSAFTWTPADLGSALQLWLDATVVTPSGTDVETWPDQSGRGYDVTDWFDPGNRFATYDATGLNGHPTIQFTTNRLGNFPTLANTVTQVTTMNSSVSSFFFVGQSRSGSGTTFGVANGFLNNGDAFLFSGTGSVLSAAKSGSLTLIKWQQAAGTGSNYTISTDTPYRIGSVFDGVNGTTYVNNVAGTPVAVSFTLGNAGAFCIGNGLEGGPGFANAWDGPISEVVVTNTALSISDRLNLDTYFKLKWGLS